MNKKIIIGIIVAVIIIVGIIIISSTPINVAQRKYDDAPRIGLRYMYNLERNDKVASFYTQVIFRELLELRKSQDMQEDIYAYLKTLNLHDVTSYYNSHGLTGEYAQDLIDVPSYFDNKTTFYSQSYMDAIAQVLLIFEENCDTEWNLQSIPVHDLMQMVLSFENKDGYYSNAANQFPEDYFTESNYSSRNGYHGESRSSQEMTNAWYYGDYAIVVTEVYYYSEGELGWDDFGNFHDKPSRSSKHAECYVFYKGEELMYRDSDELHLYNATLDVPAFKNCKAYSETSAAELTHPKANGRGNDILDSLFASEFKFYKIIPAEQ